MLIPVVSHSVHIRPTTSFVVEVAQFGTVSLLDMPYADHDFVYSNTGTSPVVIDRLQPSCHCTSALIASDRNPDGESLPYTLAPGASVKIHAAINLGMAPSGPVSRTVSIYLKNQNEPAAIFTLTGTVEPDVVFSPSILDFGVISAGHSSQVSVQVSVDNRLIPDGFPTLVSDNPNIVITPMPGLYHGPAKFTAQRPDGETDKQYEVTIPSNMAIGRINSALSLVGGPQTLPAATAQYESDNALIVGKVTGSISADPEAVSFGTILTGQPGVETVTLAGKTVADVTGLKAASSTLYLTAKLAKPGKNATDILTLAIKKTTPSGLFNSKVTITLVNGQKLIIPVTGYVTIPAR